jgi:cytochrome c oxidase subunit II
MVDSSVVLSGQTLAYTLYASVMILLMAWFSYRLTRKSGESSVRPAVFYTFVGFLAILGVSLHIITYNTIPWAPMDLHRSSISADRVFVITVADHRFHLPSERMIVHCNEKVLFRVTSEDLTYGFGLFRIDNSMLFQMQVVPGHDNDLLWQFDRPGVYSIRSTEYSGPKGIRMIEKDAVEVLCPQSSAK